MKTNHSSNHWRTATIVLIFIAAILMGLQLYEKSQEEYVDLKDFSITEEQLTSFVDIFGTKPFKICSLKENI